MLLSSVGSLFGRVRAREQQSQHGMSRLCSVSVLGHALSGSGLFKQRLSTLMTELGHGGSLHVLLGFTLSHVVTADDSSVTFHELRLSRHRVQLAAPAFSLHLNALDYQLTESCVIVLCCVDSVSKAPPLFAVVSFAPATSSSPEQHLDSESEVMEQCLRPGTVFIFRGCHLLVRQAFDFLSILPEHHQLWAWEESFCACFNNGASLEWFQDDDAPQGRLPSELTGVEVVSMQGSQYLTVAPTTEQSSTTTTTTTRRLSFNAALFSPLLVRHAYPNLQAPSIADLEVRMLGPCSTANYYLVVLGLCLLYRGGGKELGALLALDTNLDTEGFGNAHVLRWVDLRKLLVDTRSTDADSRQSWLSQATSAWSSALLQRDPRLRELHARTQALSTARMDTNGSLRSLLHPFLPLLVVHDEEEEEY